MFCVTLRAGYVFLPLNTAYRAAEIEYFIGNAEPEVVVCSGDLTTPMTEHPSGTLRLRGTPLEIAVESVFATLDE